MPHATYHDLIVAAGGRLLGELRPAQPIGRVRTDSRQVAEGDLFWALPGTTLNGHDFVGEAYRRGAACCVVQESRPAFAGRPQIVVSDSLQALADFAGWYRQSREAMVIGITGSVGKTTTRHMLHAVLSARFAGSQSPANFNNHVGVPLSLLEIEPQHEFAVIEMGASGIGEIARLAAIARPEVAIVTAVAPAHLGPFGSIDAIARTKGELVESLPAHGLAVLNGDDPRVRQMASRTAARVILVGEGLDNDVRADRIQVENDRLTFTVGGRDFLLRAAGRHFVLSALACVAVAREIGLTDSEIAAGLEAFRPVAGRCRPLQIGPWTLLDDTYNSSPRAAAAACQLLGDWRTSAHKWFVLGDMLELGSDSSRLHRELGIAAANSRPDGIIACGQFAADVAAGARDAGFDCGRLAVCRDLSLVMLHLDCWLSPGDVVLVKGSRGMRMESVIAELKERVEPVAEQPRLAA